MFIKGTKKWTELDDLPTAFKSSGNCHVFGPAPLYMKIGDNIIINYVRVQTGSKSKSFPALWQDEYPGNGISRDLEVVAGTHQVHISGVNLDGIPSPWS